VTPTIISNAVFQIKIETARVLLRAVLGAWERRECLGTLGFEHGSRVVVVRAASAGTIEVRQEVSF
jgi:hypothetical protein